jgi:hypothetical protein
VLQETHMIELIIAKLGHTGERKMPRTDSAKPISLGCGMQNVHLILQQLATQINNTDTNPDIIQSHWIISNESDDGYLLTATHPDVCLDSVVGEILCIMHDASITSTEACELAIIRWIRREQDNKFRVGVERIPGNPLPIFYRIESQYGFDTDDDTRHPGLYIPKSDKANSDSILILKEDFNKEGDIHLYYQNKQFTTSMIALLHDSPLYMHLKIKR